MSSFLDLSDIQRKIHEIRNQKVILDRDLADLYHVDTRYLNKAVKRNVERFPEKFMFQLNKTELENLMFQFGTSSWGGTRKLPYVFTEHGTLMVASILKSGIAIQINQKIIEAFIELRKNILQQSDYKSLLETVNRIELRMDNLDTNHLVDKTILSTKIQQISQSVALFSELMDTFQNTHIIIKRPNDAEIQG